MIRRNSLLGRPNNNLEKNNVPEQLSAKFLDNAERFRKGKGSSRIEADPLSPVISKVSPQAPQTCLSSRSGASSVSQESAPDCPSDTALRDVPKGNVSDMIEIYQKDVEKCLVGLLSVQEYYGKKLIAIFKQNNEKTDKLSNELDRLSEENKQLRESLNAAKEEKEGIVALAQNVCSTHDFMQVENTKLGNEKIELLNNKFVLSQEIRHKDLKIEEMTKEIEDMKGYVVLLENKINGMNNQTSDLADKDERIKNLEKQNAKQVIRIKQLEKTVNETTLDLRQLHDLLDAYQKQLRNRNTPNGHEGPSYGSDSDNAV